LYAENGTQIVGVGEEKYPLEKSLKSKSS